MKPEVDSELQRITSEIHRGPAPLDASALANRLCPLGALISTVDLPDVMPKILKVLGAGAGLHYVPQFVRQVVGRLLEGQRAETVCDPWAGFGELLAIASAATHGTAVPRNDIFG
jgi:hypothetical protein